jgi:hypothetical protein
MLAEEATLAPLHTFRHPLLENPNRHHQKNEPLNPGVVFPDTAFKPGFEIVKFLTYIILLVVEPQLFISL